MFKVQDKEEKHIRKGGVSVLDDLSSFLPSSFTFSTLFLLCVCSFCLTWQHSLCPKIVAVCFCFKWKLRTGDGVVLVLLDSEIKALMCCRHEWKWRKMHVNIWIYSFSVSFKSIFPYFHLIWNNRGDNICYWKIM